MIEIVGKEKRLKTLEDIIEHSKTRAETHWFEVGKALTKIRNDELYPQQTFEQYCLQRWGFKRHRAYQLCNAFESLKESKMLTSGQQISERVARELIDVPPEKRQEVIEEASKDGKPTAKSTKAAAAKTKPPKPERDKDKNDYPIPDRAVAIWNRRGEVKEKIRPLHELKQWITDMQGTNDPLYNVTGFSLNKLVTEIRAFIHHFQQAIPEVVCTKCQGIDPGCDFCKGRGMISLDVARGYTPIEMKEMRDKLASNDSVEKLSSSGR